MERRTSGKRVYVKSVSGVRIPVSPHSFLFFLDNENPDF